MNELRGRSAVARTVEDVPGTPHHIVRPVQVTATASETPRILDRAGRRPVPAFCTVHRMPVPSAPTAPASVIAGPATSSSNAAGPAFSIPGGGDDPHGERMFKITLDTGPDPALIVKDAPVHTPD
jgi:hypothetical protein